MKRVRFLRDYHWARKGDVKDISDDRARHLCYKHVNVEETINSGQIVRDDGIAVVIQDLGHHFGRSKHKFKEDGISEAYGGS